MRLQGINSQFEERCHDISLFGSVLWRLITKIAHDYLLVEAKVFFRCFSMIFNLLELYEQDLEQLFPQSSLSFTYLYEGISEAFSDFGIFDFNQALNNEFVAQK